ncbi:MAG: SMC-Scp complex subunit ScpB [Spirochaetaceae bacterium]|jgi:segregation and condensation protein B|nr:SMC-Scp complex subunit ScpB [Spirochaetaceae bacterium]
MGTPSALLESILYLESDPVDKALLAKRSGLDMESVSAALEQLQDRLNASECGIELVHIGSGFQLLPKQEYWDLLKEHYGKKNDVRLSRAALETLSIIAYSQPITRAEIESIRGVSADTMIRLLVEKGLIKEIGKKDAPGKPTLFGTTKEFLRVFHLTSIADLPKLTDSDQERFALPLVNGTEDGLTEDGVEQAPDSDL